jgi:molybdopterin synthase catalytic subunit
VAADVKDIRILHGELSPGRAMENFATTCPEAGGIVSFVGKVRPDNDVEELELKHYAPLTLKGREELAEATLSRWKLEGLLLHHRTGRMRPGDPIVLVAAAARHRRDAFEAADYAMDHLKSDAWFWKREKRDGEWHWVEPRDQDRLDLARWS